MIEVITAQVKDHKYQRRDTEAIQGIMLHRCGVDLKANVVIGYDAVAICDAFTGLRPEWAAVAKVTGGQNPYTFLVGGDLGPAQYNGKIWQALPLDEIGHHARRFSSSFMGVALIGDMRVTAPSPRQWLAAVDLVADLCLMFNKATRRIFGHGELAHGSKGHGKSGACPGEHLDMDAFREAVRNQMRIKVRQDAYWRLEQGGAEMI